MYYYRRRFQRPLKGEITLSLRTNCYRKAEYLSEALDRRWPMVAEMATLEDVRQIVAQYLNELLEDDLDYYHLKRSSEPLYEALYKSSSGQSPREADQRHLETLLAEARQILVSQDFEAERETIDDLMREHQLPESLRGPLSHGVLRARVEALETFLKRVTGHFEPIAQPPAQAPATAKPKPTGELLSKTLPEFIDYGTKNKGWTGQTLSQNKGTYSMFIEWCGDKPVDAYTRDETSSFYNMLRQLPNTHGKSSKDRDLSLKQVIENKGKDAECLSMKTIKRHFSALGVLFDYLKRHNKYTGENPAYGFEFPMPKRKNSARHRWDDESLAKLFASPIWTGRDPEERTKAGECVIRDAYYWLPILGLYHGNRLEEFAQLLRSDIRLEPTATLPAEYDGLSADCLLGQTGIWHFDINDEDDKQLKNDQSIRRVPIHPEILRLGFLPWLNAQSLKPDDEVFPDLERGGRDAKKGHYFSKNFSYYRKSIGVYRKGVDYHSFRHGVTTKLYEADVTDAVVNELVGHEGTGTSQQVYKKALALSTLLKAISKVTWPEFGLEPKL